jgi:hypothetical protein
VDSAITADLARARHTFRFTQVYGTNNNCGAADAAIDKQHLRSVMNAATENSGNTCGASRADISLSSLARAAHNMTVGNAARDGTRSNKAEVFDETRESVRIQFELIPLDGDYSPQLSGPEFAKAIRHATAEHQCNEETKSEGTGFKCEWTRARNITGISVSLRVYPPALADVVYNKYKGYPGRTYYHNGTLCRLRAVSKAGGITHSHLPREATLCPTSEFRAPAGSTIGNTPRQVPIEIAHVATMDLPSLLDLAGDQIVILQHAFDSHANACNGVIKKSDLPTLYARGLRDIDVPADVLPVALEALCKHGWEDNRRDVSCFLRVMLAARAIAASRVRNRAKTHASHISLNVEQTHGQCTKCDGTTYLCSSCSALHTIQPEDIARTLRRLDAYGKTKGKGSRKVSLQLNPFDAVTCLGNLGVCLSRTEKAAVGRWCERRLGGVRPFMSHTDVVAMLDWLTKRRRSGDST